ncbi:MAG TPA: carbohydrate kinase family protein [Streptosporangiaceae bacterium]|nr:carbohydrate kinase family protein [Streptosporangiaceae bacterium]
MGGAGTAAPRVDCVGPLNMDLLIRGSAPLDPGELRRWVGPSEVELLTAGSIGYTVQALGRLDCSVRVFSAVGDDAFGAQILRELAAQGIDTSGVRVAPGITSIAIYPLLFGGTKRPMTYRLSDITPWPARVAVDDGGGRPDCLLFAGLLHFKRMYHSGMAQSFAAARQAGVITALDAQFPLEPTPVPWLPHISDVLAHTDLFFCDEHEAESIFGTGSPARAALSAISHGCRTAVVKMGEEGAIITDGTQVIEQPAVGLGQRVDETVGAGDSFDAGFLAALLRGAGPAEAARQATATAACSLVRAGGALAIDPAGVVSMLPSVPPARTVRA